MYTLGALDGSTGTSGSLCEWQIQVPAGRVVRLKFDSFSFMDDLGDVTISDVIAETTLLTANKNADPGSGYFYTKGDKARIIFNRGSSRNGIRISWKSVKMDCCSHVRISSQHNRFNRAKATGVFIKTLSDFTGVGNWPLYRKYGESKTYLAHKRQSGGMTPWKIGDEDVTPPGQAGRVFESVGRDFACPEHLVHFLTGLSNSPYSQSMQVECLETCSSEPPILEGATNDYEDSNFVGAIVTYTCANDGQSFTSTCGNNQQWSTINGECSQGCCDVLTINSQNSNFDSNLNGDYEKSSQVVTFGSKTWPVYISRRDPDKFLAHKRQLGGATPWHIKSFTNGVPGGTGRALELLGPDEECPQNTRRFHAGGTVYSTDISITCSVNSVMCCDKIKIDSNHAAFGDDIKGEYVKSEDVRTGDSGQWPVYFKKSDNEVHLSRKTQPGGATPWRLKRGGTPGQHRPYLKIVGPDEQCPNELSKFFVGNGNGFSSDLTVTCVKACCESLRLTFDSAYSGVYTKTLEVFGNEEWPVYKFNEDNSIILAHRTQAGGRTPWHVRRTNSLAALEFLGPDGDCPTVIDTIFEGNRYTNNVQVACLD